MIIESESNCSPMTPAIHYIFGLIRLKGILFTVHLIHFCIFYDLLLKLSATLSSSVHSHIAAIFMQQRHLAHPWKKKVSKAFLLSLVNQVISGLIILISNTEHPSLHLSNTERDVCEYQSQLEVKKSSRCQSYFTFYLVNK